MTKNQIRRLIVPSESSSAEYVVCEYDDGSWSCSCPKWKFHRGERVDCKHILSCKAERHIETTINVSGCNIKEEKKEVVFNNETS